MGSAWVEVDFFVKTNQAAENWEPYQITQKLYIIDRLRKEIREVIAIENIKLLLGKYNCFISTVSILQVSNAKL